MHIWLLSALSPPNGFLFSFSHPQLSLLLHLAVAHLGRIIKSKVIRFFTLAQYTFIQTIIPVSFSHLNQVLHHRQDADCRFHSARRCCSASCRSCKISPKHHTSLTLLPTTNNHPGLDQRPSFFMPFQYKQYL